MNDEINNEITTDTNGKLTIQLDTKNQILYVFFDTCLIHTSTLKHITVSNCLIFIDGCTYDRIFFCEEQLNFLRGLKQTKFI